MLNPTDTIGGSTVNVIRLFVDDCFRITDLPENGFAYISDQLGIAYERERDQRSHPQLPGLAQEAGGETVKRYDPIQRYDQSEYPWCDMEECADGDYVKHDDLDTLTRERDALRSCVDKLREYAQHWTYCASAGYSGKPCDCGLRDLLNEIDSTTP